LQRALKIEDGGFDTTAAGRTKPIDPALLFVPQNIDWIRVYGETIRLLSPNRNNRSDIDPIDDEKTRQTIAHEIGHGVALDHVNVNWVCPLPPSFSMTVMIGEYFQQSNNARPANGVDPMCAWLQPIPHFYRAGELDSFRLR
jgi:hypothetical protein